ncbi:mitochondrial large subunit ribosomal protein-domain-containing protein [Sparassis latifolia]
MLRAFLPRARCYSQIAVNASQPTSAHTQLPYHVPRNTRGSIPVYTDIRNGGTQHLTLIRNIEGNIDALAMDLAQSLFAPGSPEALRLKIHSLRSKHLVLSGGRWKPDVVRWLLSKGF